MTTLKFDPSLGDLTLHTGVAGSAAKMGHRLVIEVRDWEANAELNGGQITSISLKAQLRSIAVRSGEGGVKPLSDGDRETIAANAARALESAKYPEVAFRATEPVAVPQGPGEFQVRGMLAIHGRERAITATVRVTQAGAQWHAETDVPVTQSDFGIKAYATMLGQLRVADEVTVALKVGPFQV